MQNVLLLHGAIGASGQLKVLADKLSKIFKVYTIDFSGHGSRQDENAPFSIELFATDVLRFMTGNKLDKVSVFGYSMGGYVGMCLARNHPDKIDKLITLATKYHWDEATAAKEIQMLNPEKIELKIPAFAETLKQRHGPDNWKEVLKKTSEMMLELGGNNMLQHVDYQSINTPALLLLGDHDKMVTLEETVAVYKALPNAQMGILPGTQHPIEQVDTELLSFMISRVLN